MLKQLTMVKNKLTIRKTDNSNINDFMSQGNGSTCYRIEILQRCPLITVESSCKSITEIL